MMCTYSVYTDLYKGERQRSVKATSHATLGELLGRLRHPHTQRAGGSAGARLAVPAPGGVGTGAARADLAPAARAPPVVRGAPGDSAGFGFRQVVCIGVVM